MHKLQIVALPILADNYCYLLFDAEAQGWVAIDPGEAPPIIDFCRTQKTKITAILSTHHHYDHVEGNPPLQELFQCPVYGNLADGARIPALTQGLVVGKPYQFAGFDCEVLATNGHTRGHCAYYFPQAEALFCGDTLFSAGCGRILEGSAEELYHSVNQIIGQLPETTRIYFGHEYTEKNLAFALQQEPDNLALREYHDRVKQLRQSGLPTTPTTLKLEKRINPFLRCPTVEPLAHFAKLREQRNHFRG